MARETAPPYPSAVVVDCGFPRCRHVGDALEAIGCSYTIVPVELALDTVLKRQPELVIVTATDAEPERELNCLHRLRSAATRPNYLFLTNASSEDLAIAALRSGAQQYLREPWTPPMLQAAVAPLLPIRPVATEIGETIVGSKRLVGASAPIRQLRSHLARIASASSTVLILGETGTGKELVAELIHLNGARANRPFVCINTAAIPDALLENELFGHERGAFTSAMTSERGKLAAAEGGTVFLDEIGDVSLSIQAKLLRAIENKAIFRLGGTRSVQLDVRILAATNGDLEGATRDKRFRLDLYYRLNVVRVEVPPLRERREDIPALVSHYLLLLNRELGRSVRGLSTRAMDTLCGYHWPGNVRELRNVIEALLVNLAPETTGVVDVPPEVMRQLALVTGAPASERERLVNALIGTKWNKTQAATRLRMSRMTLYRKMQRYNVAERG